MQNNLINKIIHKVSGYVTVVVEGFFLEKFTNLCAKNSISFWNVRRMGTSKMIIDTKIKDFKKMKKLARKSGCKIQIKSKRGLPFKLFKYRKRKLFLIGIGVFLIIVISISSFVLNIEINGLESISEVEIRENLEELGLKKWSLKSKIDKNEIIYKMMIKRDDLSFLSVDIKGTTAIVKLVEKVKIPDIVPKDEPCDIVALKAGVIKNIEVFSGTTMVAVNDTVNKGQLLVSRVIEMKNFPEKTEEVHSMARIIARVWYEQSERLMIVDNIDVSKLEVFAYRIAYDKIKEQIPDEAEIIDEKVTYEYGEDYVQANIIIETSEDIASKMS